MSMNISQAALNAVVVESEFLVVNPEQVQNGGMEIMWGNYVLLCLKAVTPAARVPDLMNSRRLGMVLFIGVL